MHAALAQVVPLSDQRVLAYEEVVRGPGYVRRHRELDAISINDCVTVFDVKATRSEMAARGTSQLRKAGTILQTGTLGRTRGVALVLIWVDTGGRPIELADWLRSRVSMASASQSMPISSAPTSRASPLGTHGFCTATSASWSKRVFGKTTKPKPRSLSVDDRPLSREAWLESTKAATSRRHVPGKPTKSHSRPPAQASTRKVTGCVNQQP